MKRFHVHVSVDDLAKNIRFYSIMFGAPPTVEKTDYTKWMLDDPRINFAVSQRGGAAGVNYPGFQERPRIIFQGSAIGMPRARRRRRASETRHSFRGFVRPRRFSWRRFWRPSHERCTSRCR